MDDCILLRIVLLVSVLALAVNVYTLDLVQNAGPGGPPANTGPGGADPGVGSTAPVNYAGAKGFVKVTCDGCGIAGLAGSYEESVCDGPGFEYRGQHPDTYTCFLKGSDWRVYQTGCGWEVQEKVQRERPFPEEMEWERRARTYTGKCSAMPECQYSIQALTTDTTYDGFGERQEGISLAHCHAACARGCAG